MRDKHPTFCMIMEFPSLCGDKLKYIDYCNRMEAKRFPSPCGDKLK